MAEDKGGLDAVLKESVDLVTSSSLDGMVVHLFLGCSWV